MEICKYMMKNLYAKAEEARKNAYAPYSNFQVGAAVLTEDGDIYTGVNVENSSYGATICAERTALVKAISEGERSFAAIAISAGHVEAIPCGICRQFMNDLAPDIQVITMKDGELRKQPLSDLYPQGFTL